MTTQEMLRYHDTLNERELATLMAQNARKLRDLHLPETGTTMTDEEQCFLLESVDDQVRLLLNAFRSRMRDKVRATSK